MDAPLSRLLGGCVQGLGAGKVGGARAGVAEVDLAGAVPGQCFVRADGVELDAVGVRARPARCRR